MEFLETTRYPQACCGLESRLESPRSGKLARPRARFLFQLQRIWCIIQSPVQPRVQLSVSWHRFLWRLVFACVGLLFIWVPRESSAAFGLTSATDSYTV